MPLSLPLISETFDRHGVNGKQLLRALGEYLDLAYELRAGLDPMKDPFFFLQESDKIEVVEAFSGFVRSNSALLGAFDDDALDEDEGLGNGDEDQE